MHSRTARNVAYAAAIFSLLAALYDMLNVGFAGDFLYLWPESIARVVMVAFALLLARNAWRQARARLFIVALIGLSLDLYWQTPWAYTADAARWAAMLVKYGGVAIGLAALLRLATHLSGERPTKAGKTLFMAAPWLGAVLFIVGAIHGALWIENGEATGFHVPALVAVSHAFYVAYYGMAIVIRIAIIAAAVDGFVGRTANRKGAVIVAVSLAFFGLGTILNFGLRLLPNYDQVPGWPDALDSLSTLLLVLGFTLAGRRRQLPGIEVPALIDRALLAGFQGVMLSCTFVTVEYAANELINSRVVERIIDAHTLSQRKDIFSLVVALAISWMLKPAEAWAERLLPSEHRPHAQATPSQGEAP